MRLVIMTLMTLVLVNCTRSSNEKNDETSAAAKVPQKNGPCAPLGFSHDEALAVWKMQNGVELILCNAYESKIVSEDEFTGWLNVYVKEGDKLSPYIKDVRSEKPGVLSHFTIKHEGPDKVRVVRKLNSAINSGGLAIPLTEFTIVCTGSTCEKAGEKCLTLPKKVDDEAIEIVQKVAARESKAHKSPRYEAIMARVVESAIAGDTRAWRQVLQTAAKRLKADGATGEILIEGRELMTTLINLGCLKAKKAR